MRFSSLIRYFMKFKPHHDSYVLSSEEQEYLNSVTHRNDINRNLVFSPFFLYKPNISELHVADSAADFLIDLERGYIDSDSVEQNREYQFKGSSESDCENMNEIFGFQVVDRLAAFDKNYNPAGWRSVRERLGLDEVFNKKTPLTTTVDDLPE